MGSKEKAIEIISKSKLGTGRVSAEENLVSLIAEALDSERDAALEEAAKEILMALPNDNQASREYEKRLSFNNSWTGLQTWWDAVQWVRRIYWDKAQAIRALKATKDEV